MKLEFLEDISDGGKYPNADPAELIRLYDFDNIQATMLNDIIQKRIINQNQIVDLTTIDFIQPLNCSLTLQISNEDFGILLIDKNEFICRLTTDSYKKMTMLIDPFCENGRKGYQWL